MINVDLKEILEEYEISIDLEKFAYFCMRKNLKGFKDVFLAF